MKPVLQIGFLTGQSNPRSCALSPAQHAFLRQIEMPEMVSIELNFPYRQGPGFTPVPLWQASLNNLKQYLFSRRHGFAASYRADVIRVIDQAHHTLFLAGSCGLELFANLGLPSAMKQRCTLLAYGPVTRRLPPEGRVIVVQGTRDLLSRFSVNHCDHPLECSHLDYLTTPAFVRLCQDIIQKEFSPIPCNNTSA